MNLTGVWAARLAAAVAIGVAMCAAPALAQQQSGEVRITFKFNSTITKQVEDFDGKGVRTTTINQTGVMTCPVAMESESATSYIDLLPLETLGAKRELPEGEFGRFHTWMSEGCTGTITANNEVKVLSGGGKTTITEKVTGTRPLSPSVDANLVAETNLDRCRTRYWIATPDANGFARQAVDRKPEGSVFALPDGNVVIGPLPGPLKDGAFTKKVPGGEYTVDWVFLRKR
jgi:hypothetical protein